MESCDHCDVCNTLRLLGKANQAFQEHSIHHLADQPILEKMVYKAFLNGMQSFWRIVLVDTILIGTKGYSRMFSECSGTRSL